MQESIYLHNKMHQSKAHNKTYIYNGILIGLFLSADMVIKIVTALVPVQNFLVFYYLTLVLLGFAINKTKLQIKYVYLYMLITLLFGISMMRVENITYTFQYFIYFSTFYLASIPLQFELDKERIFKTINYINVPFTLFLYLVIFPSYAQGTLNMDYTMNLSYTALIGISSYVLTFTLQDFKQSKVFILINTVCILIGIYFMLFISNNRASLIGLGFLFVIILILKFKKPILRAFILGFFSLVAIYVYNNLYQVSLFINDLFLKLNISSNFINKIIWKLEYEDFSSGRLRLYTDAINQFYEAPIIGKGIGFYSFQHDGSYPHNIFLDILSSSGIFITTILCSFFLIILYRLIFAKTNNYIVLMTLLIVLSIPELLVSSSLWISPFFWALVVLVLFNPGAKQYRFFN